MATSTTEPSTRGAARECQVAVVLLSRPGGDLDATLESIAGQDGVTSRLFAIGSLADRSAARALRVQAVDDDFRALRDELGRLDAEFVTFVRAGDLLLQGSLRRLRDTLGASPDAVMAHAFWVPLDREGRAVRHAVRLHLAQLREAASSKGTVPVQGLPTFRREWFLSEVGMSGVAAADALKRAGRAATTGRRSVLVTTALCAIPFHDAPLVPPSRPRSRLRLFLGRWGPRARRFLDRMTPIPVDSPLAAARRLPRSWDMVGAVLRHFPFGWLRQSHRRRARSTSRVAYVLWRYPTLSETFIRREVEALREAGLPLEVFALKAEDSPAAVDHASPADHTTYFGPDRSPAGRAFIFERLRRHPWTVILLYLYVVRVRAGTGSTWWRDRDVFYLAGQLAPKLEAAGITHVHSPWAGPYAVIGFVAARLIRATFSVQARASEIHRTSAATGLRDRLRFAEFVVTNSRYNEQYLREVLGPASPPVHVVYNGLDLHRFPAVVRQREMDHGAFRVLAVGRLVEPKGFKHLLHACRLLVDRGMDVTCDIIGGPDSSDAVTWLELRMLQVALGLESRVRLLGAQRFTAVMEAFERADVFALPCVRARDGSHDITPNALLEAMAMRLPVVSTRSGAIPEIVDHEVNGLLVEPGDAFALADAIERLLKDGELRRSLGAAARQKVEGQFDVGRNVAPRLELFRPSGTQQT